MKKRAGLTLTGLLIAALVIFGLAACGEAEEEATSSTVTNDGLTLTIPNEYADLLAVATPDDSEDGTLFDVAEKASIEAAKEQGEDGDGAGWLFSIRKTDEDAVKKLLTGEMSGTEVFAKDGDGNYYLYCHPTDVRLVRADNEEMEASMDQWTALTEWAASVPKQFLKDNEGLTAQEFGNTDLNMYLARIAYDGYTDYTISTTQYGPLEPAGVDPASYVEPLMSGVTYEEVDLDQVPDGEYVVLDFPKDDVRFDFFLAGGSENLIRQTWSDNQVLYKASFEDKSIKASAVMQSWYDALAEKAGKKDAQ